jgi:hypothetical protein
MLSSAAAAAVTSRRPRSGGARGDLREAFVGQDFALGKHDFSVWTAVAVQVVVEYGR